MVAHDVVVDASEVGDNHIAVYKGIVVEGRVGPGGMALDPSQLSGAGKKVRRDVSVGAICIPDVPGSFLRVGDNLDLFVKTPRQPGARWG